MVTRAKMPFLGRTLCRGPTKKIIFDALGKTITPHAVPHSIPDFCLAQKSSPITKKCSGKGKTTMYLAAKRRSEKA